MKKLTAIITCIISALLSTCFIACGNSETAVADSLTFYAPDGAPALAFSKCISDNENFVEGITVNYSVVPAGDIGAKLSKGEGDLVVAPINACSKLYKANKSDPYKMVAVVTHGNLFIVSDQEITLESLKGKVVGVIGQGLVPDLTLKSILIDNGIEFETGDTPKANVVTLRYFNDASALIPFLKQKVLTVGVLPEPAHTLLKSTDSSYSYSLDVQVLYDAESKEYPQAVLMVKNSVLEKYPSLVAAVKEKFTQSVAYVSEHIAESVNAVNGALKEGVTPSLNASKINATAVNNCNMRWQDSALSKQSVNTYLEKIIAIDSSSAKVVSDDFYL